jgi:hypothetical protein
MIELTLGLIGLATLVLLIGRTLHRDDRITLSGDPGAPPAAITGTASISGQIPTETTVESLIAAGRKIEAIKLLREETGIGLREAKEAVEEISRDRSPARPSRP